MPKQATLAAAALSALLVGAAATPAATAGTAAPSLERQQATAPSRMTVDVVGDPTGFTAPTRHRPGAVTFRVRTTDPEGIRLGLVRLRDGVPVDRFLTHLTAALTERGMAAAAAGRQLADEATMLGGALAVPGRTAEFRQRLGEGTYYLVDYQDADAGRPLTAHELVVDGSWAPAPPLVADSAITMVDTSDGPRFRVRRPLTADSTIAVTNRTGQLDEAVFVPVHPETTEADLRAFFEAMNAGQRPPVMPFTGAPPSGMPVLEPGARALVRPALDPGRYALVSWVVDLEDGTLLAARGMHTLVTVR